MTKTTRRHGEDLLGATRLALDATRGVMRLVQTVHRTIASGPAVLGQPLQLPARVLTDAVYGSLLGVTDLVGGVVEKALTELAPWMGEGTPGPEREALVAALNGVLGDHMAATGNPLALVACLRSEGVALELTSEALRALFPSASGRLCVLVHGSSMSDLQWRRNGHDHGESLARELGLTAVYAQYNSGLHVSDNGRSLAALLDALVRAWPTPVEDLTLVAHSMGGLVARSACLHAEREGLAFRAKLRAMVFLGTPHHGAPLERLGNWLDTLLGVSRYSAPFVVLAKLRSAGVTDLRYGIVREEDWHGRDRFALGEDPRTPTALPESVRCYAIAASRSEGPTESPAGDGLVPVDSALGRHEDPSLALLFPAERQHIAYGAGHNDLLDRPEVFQKLLAWIAEK